MDDGQIYFCFLTLRTYADCAVIRLLARRWSIVVVIVADCFFRVYEMSFIMISDRRMSSGRGQARTPFSFGLVKNNIICRQRVQLKTSKHDEIGKKKQKKITLRIIIFYRRFPPPHYTVISTHIIIKYASRYVG